MGWRLKRVLPERGKEVKKILMTHVWRMRESKGEIEREREADAISHWHRYDFCNFFYSSYISFHLEKSPISFMCTRIEWVSFYVCWNIYVWYGVNVAFWSIGRSLCHIPLTVMEHLFYIIIQPLNISWNTTTMTMGVYPKRLELCRYLHIAHLTLSCLPVGDVMLRIHATTWASYEGDCVWGVRLVSLFSDMLYVSILCW